MNIFDNLKNLFSSLDLNIRTPLAISLGAIPGALIRYYLTLFLSRCLGNNFPYGTFFINITGAIFMGFFVTFTLSKAIDSPDLRLLIAVGFLGSYTTFSTYALDSSILLRNNLGWGSFYYLGSAFLGLLGLEIGNLIARKLL